MFAGCDGTHPILQSELGKFGPFHLVQSKFFYSGSGNEVVLAHRIRTHNIWSSTGVTNSAFVVVPRGFTTELLVTFLKVIAKDEISFGTDDFLIIIDDGFENAEGYSETLPDPKRFTFLIHDLLLNTSESSLETERRDFFDMRKKANIK